MKKLVYMFIMLMLALPLAALSQTSSARYFDVEIPRKANRELQFFAFFINQGVTQNFHPTSEFLRGQVVGRLFGRNTTTTSDTATSAFIEQRIIPFFVYQPNLFNGRATLRASFEIDWTWGDAAYGTGGNLGGAISADQVNIQTQNISLELIPWNRWSLNIGLQRMFDTPFNPYRTFFDKMTQTGYRLAYFGTDAVGITLRHDRDFSRFKAGFYKLYENDIFRNDDVNLFEFTFEQCLTPQWKAGASIYYLRDRAQGKGGVSILGQGLNSLLNEYNGTFKFRFGTDPYEADIFWLGGFFSRNADMMLDRVHLTGFFNYNLGRANVLRNGTWQKGASIGGFAANLKAMYRFGQTTNDHLRLDLLYASGDDNGINDQHYSGVLTGNMWGAPAAIFISSGAYILMPHGNVVNRFTPAVADLSNMGYGLSAATFTASRNIITHRLTGRVGGALAFSNAQPLAGGSFIGSEANAAMIFQIGPFMSLELHGAHLWLGSFYDSADERFGAPVNGGVYGVRPVSPWKTFLVYKWLMF